MKLFEDVLSEELLDEITTDIYSKLNKGIWNSSILSWPQDVKNHITGTINTTDIEEPLRGKLLAEFEEYHPYKDESKVFAIYYLMTPNAGISVHTDNDEYIWNATIYLNETWSPDWGGLLLWEDEGRDYFRGVVPKKNRMVLFNTNKYHLVTPVAPTAGELRVTIQLRESEKHKNVGNI